MALRVFPKLLYGEGHAYSLPMTGSGTEASVLQLSRDDIIAFHDTWFRSRNATLVVVGDTTLDTMVPILETRFQELKDRPVPAKNITEVSHRDTSIVYLIDRPGSVQSIVFAGHIAPPRNIPNNLAISALNRILGGSFTSRINLNLREDKGWCYGAQSAIVPARGQRPFIVVASVQDDKTADAMHEILRELQDIRGPKPPTADDVLKTQEGLTRTLAGQWETMDAVEGSILTMIQHDSPPDYYHTYADRVRALDVEQVLAAAHSVIQPDRLVWVVVGDRTTIESDLRAFAGGQIPVIDADGNVLED